MTTRPQPAPDADQRKAIYEAILEALLSGQSLTDPEIQALAYGILRDPEVNVDAELQSVFNLLDQKETSAPGTTQREAFERAIQQADTIEVDPVFQTIQDALVGGAAGAVGKIAMGAAQGAGTLIGAGGGAAEAAGIVGQGLTSIAKSPWTALKAVGRGWLRHKVTGTGVGLGLTGMASAMTTGEAQRVASPVGRQGDIPADQLERRALGAFQRPPTLLPDGTVVTPPPEDRGEEDEDQFIGQQLPPEAQALIDTLQGAGTAGTLGSDLGGFLEGLGIDSGGIGGNQFQQGRQTINPFDLGLIQISPDTFPFGITAGGDPASFVGDFLVSEYERRRQERIQEQHSYGIPPDQLERIATKLAPPPGVAAIPPGAAINQRVMRTFGGKTLLQITIDAAARWNVPVEVLYGIVNHESGYNPNAVGDNGNSFGLGQIFLPAHPDVQRGQALNPVWALNWTARNIRTGYTKLGSWTAAIMYHNNPAGATEWARTGKIEDEARASKLQGYLERVLTGAVQSGLGDTVWDELPDIAGEGGGGAVGPTAAQINNVKAQIREFWHQWMGPDPADDGFLNQWARDIAVGNKGQDELQQSLQKMSASRWPTKPADQNWSEWSTPFRQRMQSLLELPSLDLNDQLLHQILNADPEGIGFEQMIRDDPRYQKTTQFRDGFLRNATQIGKLMGFEA